MLKAPVTEWCCVMPQTALPLAQMMPGMEWFPLMFLVIAIGTCTGIAAIAMRCFLCSQSAGLVLSIFTIVCGVFTTAAFGAVLGFRLNVRGYALMAFPAFLGIVGLIVHRRPESRRGFSVLPARPEV